MLATIQIAPRFQAKAGTILDAQRVRGLETEGGMGRRIRALLPLVVPLVLGSIIDIEERAMALDARAFSRQGVKTSLLVLHDTITQRVTRILAAACHGRRSGLGDLAEAGALISVKGFTYTYPASAAAGAPRRGSRSGRGRVPGHRGANLSGKSTLCFALSGFIPDFYRGTVKGQITVAGIDLVKTPLAKLAGEIGLVFANPFNQITGARFTVREELAFGLENMGCPREEMLPRIEEVLRLTGLRELADRSPYALSGGQQQRLAIASVMVMRPKVLVLDEPTSQLDPVGTREVFETLDSLTKTGMTVVLAEHKLEWIAVHADRVIVLQDGRIVQEGPPREVLASPDLARWGLTPTRYTQAARLAVEQGLVDASGPLPVTLDQAIAFFS